MKKIGILLALCMMLAGCTELAGDSTESGEFTNQDLEGIYMAADFGLYVDMNADDTYVVSVLNIEDCYDTEGEANSAMAELNADEYFEDEYGAGATTMVANNCVYVQQSYGEEDGVSFNYTLSSHAGTPYISLGSETSETRVYLGADGYGTLIFQEGMIDDDTYCVSMGPSEGMLAFYQAMNEMENLSDEELEDFDVEDFSTYPTILTDMFTVFDQNYAVSAASSLTSADCGELESMLMSWWLYLWAVASSLEDPDGGFSMYDFDVIDASSETPTSTAGEDLVYVSMDTGDDLSWSSTAVQISVDGSAYSTCTNPDQASDTVCVVSDDGDGMWAFGEEVTIAEGSDDICNGPCDLKVKILDMTSNSLIYESSIIYVS